MLEINVNGERYRDKVDGCWLGKNAGGTLGAPLEEAFGKPEPLDVWWYTQVEEGGIPNDDLEMQLIWLKAIEEVGPGLTSRHLVRYWLDHIGYNPDEYGLSKMNMKLGLEPPLSGSYSNWFKDCMGCPIRSEIWACLAPGAPRIAARYAYMDAICDHAGGESVYGELFNVALESATFVIEDVQELIDIGMSYIPESSLTARAINAARSAHAEGLDWKQARERVMQATPHYNAQYSPLNMGFQIIGLLYGEDFGDALCKTVNCGYDTDSSGASTGSYLGLISGRSGLPAKWLEPLGETISTTESLRGIMNVSDVRNPIPTNMTELTDRVQRAARMVLRAHGVMGEDGIVRVSKEDLYADDAIIALRDSSPTEVFFPGLDVDVAVEYIDLPAIASGETKSLITRLENIRPQAITVTCVIDGPSGWGLPEAQRVELPAHGSADISWHVTGPAPADLHNSNILYLTVTPHERPPQPSIPIVLVGAGSYRVSGPFPLSDGESAAEELALPHEPETRVGDVLTEGGRAGDWRTIAAHENALPLADVFDEPGILYLQGFIEAPAEQEIWLSANVNCPVKFWVNGVAAQSFADYQEVRPSYRGREETAAAVMLNAGWNEVLVKLVRGTEAPPIECHILAASNDRRINGEANWATLAGQPHLGRTRFPWQ
ncbi:ADP-ribosylglycohydrolase family protein [Microbacterium immunditiarum]|uniref:ADP-ribosylglycohydrolase n=1 Tax=Microbacterium immunditiarum TaxID=337480 RepID=A0A7Y9KN83_9MICO|nr:ADP-ribosylglycohydrolase family protein [Microbacterium immunditiarum]NYE21594.1 ADP-ribosylglycohydrolase [Microbacterium immunditiarum]